MVERSVHLRSHILLIEQEQVTLSQKLNIMECKYAFLVAEKFNDTSETLKVPESSEKTEEANKRKSQ